MPSTQREINSYHNKTQPIQINENVKFKGQARYYYKNKALINKRNKDYIVEYQRLHYNEEKKKQKSEYYFKNRNYRNLNFSRDIVKMFSIPLEVC